MYSRVWSVKCTVWSVNCAVSNAVKETELGIAYGVCSVECGV